MPIEYEDTDVSTDVGNVIELVSSPEVDIGIVNDSVRTGERDVFVEDENPEVSTDVGDPDSLVASTNIEIEVIIDDSVRVKDGNVSIEEDESSGYVRVVIIGEMPREAVSGSSLSAEDCMTVDGTRPVDVIGTMSDG